ncbi:hypothetical protein SEUBUCD646_0A00700 [Saccharomyces eubayanus]|uniref:Emp24p/erv25p-protein n=2 Tax=Saccharomyces TaxID=4930 RepID=A0A6C1E2K6_SACPS|nr:ERP2-like protein [Saccharomyces eubayanus]KOH01386.1 ERP2-like protein [Saccharomyces eubayanus]QID83211.1 emp24p/erv25p- protein [Saccharomyces pastorianus]CAI1794870.1 hypothetical protein SEUBUCD650_0A00690 [Saccharomyces eubayanus]CAI1832124.1 hypothetical protein SEUBUCD646_0A00700 [Saccharomyces eubayanus]
MIKSSIALPTFFVVLILALVNSVHASSGYAPVAITLPAFSKECLYYDMASEDDSLAVGYQVLTGGNFEIDFDITAPDGSVITSERQKKYSDFLVKSFGVGQYSFCFSNNYGTALKKVEITLEMEKSLTDASAPEMNNDDIIANNAVEEIDRNLNRITKALNYLRAREWRNMSTVNSTESRLTWLSILIMIVVVVISVAQVLLIQFLFTGRQKNYV